MLKVKITLTSPITWKNVTYYPSPTGDKVEVPEELAIAIGAKATIQDVVSKV